MENEKKDTNKLKATKEAVEYYKAIAKGRIIAVPLYILLIISLFGVGIAFIVLIDDVKAIIAGIVFILIGVCASVIVPIFIREQVLILKNINKEWGVKTKQENSKE